MNARERFRRIMNYEPVDRLPVLAIEPFEQMAIQRWHGEGLPEGVHPVDHLGMSRLVHVPLNAGPVPAYEQEVLREDEEYVVERFGWGGLVRRRKDNPTMFYGHFDPPVTGPGDWRAYRERFHISTDGRLPADWADVVPRLRNDHKITPAMSFAQTTEIGYPVHLSRTGGKDETLSCQDRADDAAVLYDAF